MVSLAIHGAGMVAARIFAARTESDPRVKEKWGALRGSVSRRRGLLRQQACGPDTPRGTDSHDATSSEAGRPRGADDSSGRNSLGPTGRAKRRLYPRGRQLAFT